MSLVKGVGAVVGERVADPAAVGEVLGVALDDAAAGLGAYQVSGVSGLMVKSSPIADGTTAASATMDA